MLLKVFGCTACIVGAAYLFIRNIFHNNETPMAAIVGLLVLALLLFISALRPSKKQRQAAQQQAAARAAAEAARRAPASRAGSAPSLTFKVAGVSFDNDDGSSRQDILRHIKFRDAPYASPDEDPDLEFIETEFDGQPAIEVHLNGYQLGWVPKAQVSNVQAALRSHAWTTDEVNIYGGSYDDSGKKHSFGCEISISWAV